MRIAFLSWESLHSIAVGGLAAHVSELSETLSRQGHEVHIFTRAGDGQAPYEQIDGVHYHRCAYERCQSFVDDMDNMCRSFVSHVIATEDYIGPFDVVHAHDWLAANAMIWIKQARGRRCILTIHSTEYGRCGNTFPGGVSELIRQRERAGTYWADQVIAVSQVTKEEVMWLYQVPDWKVAVIHNGVFARRFDARVDVAALRRKYGIRAGERVVLFCGRLATQKGPDILLEAVPDIVAAARNVRILFAGDGDMRAALEARARALKLNGAVTFLGYRKGPELPDLFHTADIVCIPSRNEPFGIVVLEAWSARKPVVVSRIGGPREFVTDGIDGIKIEPTPHAIADALIGLLLDPDEARRMGEQGRLAVEQRFTWSHIAGRTTVVYNPGLAKESSVPNSLGGARAERATELKSVPSGLRLAVQQLANTDFQLRFTGDADRTGEYWDEVVQILDSYSHFIREHVMPHFPAAGVERSPASGPKTVLPARPRRDDGFAPKGEHSEPAKRRRRRTTRSTTVAD